MKDKEETEQHRGGETSDCNTGLTPVKGERDRRLRSEEPRSEVLL